MTTTYPLLSTPAPLRLAQFKREAAKGKWAKPMTWRDVRFATLKSPTGLDSGFNGEGCSRSPVWYTQDQSSYFRNERMCDEVEGVRIDHKGWFADTDADKTVRGIVASLPHGKFIAGYLISCNDERVYFPDIFDNETDAARMADEHARIVGEAEMEHSQRFDEAQKLEISIEDNLQRLRECFTLRNNLCMSYARGEVADLIGYIRGDRETLSTDYAGVL